MAGTGSNAGNIIISAVNVKWRIEHRALFDLSGESDPDGTYFDITDTDGAVARVYFDLDAGSTPPATPAGGRLIEVDVTSGDAASVIATAVAAAIDADSKFSSSAAGSVVQVDGAEVGEVADPDPGTSNTKVTVCYKGKDFDLGLLEGEPSPTFEPSLLDVVSHQTGTTVLAKLVQGYVGNVETVLQETTLSRLGELYKIYGEAFAGPSSTVYGAGTGQIGKNLVVEAARLEFIPVNTNLDAELGYNFEYALAIPTPGSLVFSGENPRTLTVSWDALPELGATRDNLNVVRVGDASQTGVR